MPDLQGTVEKLYDDRRVSSTARCMVEHGRSVFMEFEMGDDYKARHGGSEAELGQSARC